MFRKMGPTIVFIGFIGGTVALFGSRTSASPSVDSVDSGSGGANLNSWVRQQKSIFRESALDSV